MLGRLAYIAAILVLVELLDGVVELLSGVAVKLPGEMVIVELLGGAAVELSTRVVYPPTDGTGLWTISE